MIKSLSRKFVRFVDKLDEYSKWIYLALITLSVVCLSLMFYTIIDSSHKYRTLTLENKNRIADIQNERIVNTYNACMDTNTRHDNAVEQIDLVYKDAFKKAATEADIARLNASKASTLGIIEALTPFRPDCQLYAIQQVPSIGK